MHRYLTAFGGIVLLAVTSMPAFAQDGDITKCDDQEAWAKLEGLRQKYRGTDGENDVEFLYRLRTFICVEIEAGRLTYQAAEPLFDSQKQRIVEEWKRSDDSPAQPPT